MLITELDKIILHMPRCAGSSIRWAVINAGIKYYWSCEHAPFTKRPIEFQDYSAIGFIRNPVYWYASWFHQRQKGYRAGKRTSILISLLSNNFTNSFEQFLDNALDLPKFFSDPKNIEALKFKIQDVSMRSYICWIVLVWENAATVSTDTFKSTLTLFDWWFKQVGLDKISEVYKIEDGVQEGFNLAFPGNSVKIKTQNQSSIDLNSLLTPKLIEKIRYTDSKYINQFNY